MTWQERRIVAVLSTILALLFAALLIVLGIRYRETRDKPEELPVAPGETVEQAAYTALQYSNGSTTLSFSRNDQGLWEWSDDPDFPLEPSTITAITDCLSDWKPQQTITDSAIPEDSGLDEPHAFLQATTPTGLITIQFGKTTTDGTSYYVRLNKNSETAYIIDDDLYQLMCVPIYDMCEIPRLPALQEQQLQSIVITAPASEDGTAGISTVITAQRAEDDPESTSWRSSGANVSDDPRVRALVEDLCVLSFERCILYRPSDEAAAICGLDNPTKLMVAYTTEAGSDASFDLRIGAQLPDASGRYVCLGEDPIVYFLPTAVLDPLMPLSVTGLEA